MQTIYMIRDTETKLVEYVTLDESDSKKQAVSKCREHILKDIFDTHNVIQSYRDLAMESPSHYKITSLLEGIGITEEAITKAMSDCNGSCCSIETTPIPTEPQSSE